MPGSRSSSALTMLLLPPPDGAATTKRQPAAPGLWVVMVIGPPTLAASPLRCPRRGRNSQLGAALRCSCLFQVLHLLPHLLDQYLELERHLRQLRIDGLRAERIRFPVQLLREEIQALADAAALRQHASHLRHVRDEPRDLLGDVDLRRE